MIHPVILPQLTETMEEATIVAWFKSPGERVEKQERLYEVETDKMTMEVESVDAGHLCSIRVSAGSSASVGQEIAVIADEQSECG
ncbi:MAG TPA: biotin/lipoyl-containing protein [Spirochaetia bacterium]|nr:biotin/lipoyl-containing protein [Spirochaetia bacterium]